MRQQRRLIADAGALAPEQLPNLELQLRGTSLVGAPGAAIASWADTSGHARNASQATAGKRPVISGTGPFVPDSPSGKHGAGFDFSHPDYLGGTMPDVGVTAGNTVYLWWWESPFGINGQDLFQDQSGGAPQLRVSDDSNGRIAWRDASGTWVSTTNLTADGLFHSLVFVFKTPSGGTGVADVYHNGAVVFSHTWNYSTILNTGYLVGANQVENLGFAGILYEIDYFSAAHNAALIQRVLSWGTGFWGF